MTLLKILTSLQYFVMMFVLVTALLLEISMTSLAVHNVATFNPSLSRPLGAAKYNMSRYQYEDLLITGQAPLLSHYSQKRGPQFAERSALFSPPSTDSRRHQYALPPS